MKASIIDYDLDHAKEVGLRLRRGEVGILPTDTIYGISAAVGEEGAERIFQMKNRPESKHLIVLMTMSQLAESHLHIPSGLAERWPAPFTAILRSCDDRSTVAVRIPDDDFLLSVMEHSGPIYSTSANLSGFPALNDFDVIVRTFGESADFIVRSSGRAGVSSTLIDATKEPYTVIRQGSYHF